MLSGPLIVRTTASARILACGNRSASSQAQPSKVEPRVTTSSTIVMSRGGADGCEVHRMDAACCSGVGRSAPLLSRALLATAAWRSSMQATPEQRFLSSSSWQIRKAGQFMSLTAGELRGTGTSRASAPRMPWNLPRLTCSAKRIPTLSRMSARQFLMCRTTCRDWFDSSEAPCGA